MKTTTKAVARAIKQAFEEVYIDEVMQSKLNELVTTLEEFAMGAELRDNLQKASPITMRRAELAYTIADELEDPTN